MHTYTGRVLYPVWIRHWTSTAFHQTWSIYDLFFTTVSWPLGPWKPFPISVDASNWDNCKWSFAIDAVVFVRCYILASKSLGKTNENRSAGRHSSVLLEWTTSSSTDLRIPPGVPWSPWLLVHACASVITCYYALTDLHVFVITETTWLKHSRKSPIPILSVDSLHIP